MLPAARFSAVCAVLSAAAVAAPVPGFVVADPAAPHGIRFKEGPSPPKDAIAWGVYDEEPYLSTGWATLDIHANEGELNDTLSAFAAGYLEGAFTSQFMHQFIVNSGCDKPHAPALQQWLDDNWRWMKEEVAANSPTDPYWAHLGTLLSQVRLAAASGASTFRESAPASRSAPHPPPLQMEGLVAGQASVGGRLSLQEVYNEIIGGDMHQLAALYGEGSSSGAAPPKKPTGHCSALIKVLPDTADLYVAHATWTSLYNMMRILRRFDQPFPGVGGGVPVPGRHSALSGYPAQMGYSRCARTGEGEAAVGLPYPLPYPACPPSDDFYVLSSGLVAIETSLSNNNKTRAREFGAGATYKVQRLPLCPCYRSSF